MRSAVRAAAAPTPMRTAFEALQRAHVQSARADPSAGGEQPCMDVTAARGSLRALLRATWVLSQHSGGTSDMLSARLFAGKQNARALTETSPNLACKDCELSVIHALQQVSLFSQSSGAKVGQLTLMQAVQQRDQKL